MNGFGQRQVAQVDFFHSSSIAADRADSSVNRWCVSDTSVPENMALFSAFLAMIPNGFRNDPKLGIR
jgi:hypothetical protein